MQRPEQPCPQSPQRDTQTRGVEAAEFEAREPDAAGVYRDIAVEMRGLGYTGITPLLILEVHQALLRGQAQGDIIGRTITEMLRARLAL